MEELCAGRFSMEIKKETTGNSIVIRPIGPDSEGILTFQVKMLKYNPIEGVAPFDVIRKNGDVELSYDITGCIPLREAFHDDVASTYIKMIHGFASAVSEGVKLLLSENGFLTDESCLYFDPASKMLRLIYLPFDLDVPEIRPARRLISILTAIAGPNGTLPDINEILNRGDGDLIEFILKRSNKIEPLRNNAHDEDESDVFEDEGAEFDPIEKLKQIPRMWLLIIGEAIFFVLAYFGYKEFFEGSFIAAISICTAVIILGTIAALAALKDRMANPKPDHDPDPVMNTSVETPAEKKESYETVVLYHPEQTKAELTDINNGNDVFSLSANRTVVGRNQEFADIFLGDKTVGRMHAELIRKAENWFVKDRGSVNGTKLNGNKLEDDEEHPLSDGDKLEFADRCFVFSIKSRE